MAITIEIKDEKQLAFIEKARGQSSPEDFARLAFETGLRAIDASLRNAANAIPVASTKPEFKALDSAALGEALKENKKDSPVVAEVNRLIGLYMAQMGEIAKANGNRLPNNLTVKTQAPIEQAAFQITSEIIKAQIRKAQQGGAPTVKETTAG